MAELVTKVGTSKITSTEELTSVEKVVSFYKTKLGTDSNWAIRGLLRIYQNQTAAEKGQRCTAVDNGVGFTGQDAGFLSSLAEQYLKRKHLSESQMNWLYKKMPKYARQLFNCGVAEGKVSKVGKVYVFTGKKS